jgi:hypothetical protein
MAERMGAAFAVSAAKTGGRMLRRAQAETQNETLMGE